MADELARTGSDGVGDMISVRETPWHRDGYVLPGDIDFEPAMTMARLGYEVFKSPTWHQDIDGTFLQNESAYTTRRRDTGAELGMVGPDYQPVQNREAFEVFRPLIDGKLAKIETAGVLRGGADAWMLVRWTLAEMPAGIQNAFGDMGLQPYALVSTNHTGRRGVLLQDTPVRVVCANTLGAAEGKLGGVHEYRAAGAIVVRHTANAGSRLVEAAEALWTGLGERYAAIVAQYEVLRATRLSVQQFLETVVGTVAPDPRTDRKFNPDAKLATLVVSRWEAKRDRLLHLWNHGAGHVGDGSAWEAYNGAVEALDHDADLFPHRAGSFRTASLMTGKLRQAKSAVLRELVLLGTAAD
jgi:phage/plasmid-like protein (TIGR03299 family)